jgi:hypothetical protein
VTLVAALAVGEQAVLFGDLLVSSPHPPDVITLPNFGQVQPVRDGKPAPAGMRQKLAVISRHLAIGWSGGEVAAYRVLSKVYTEYRGGRYVSSQEIFDFLDRLDPRDLAEVALIGMAYDGTVLHRFHHGGIEFDHPKFERVMAMGSGLEHFRKHMSSVGHEFQSRGLLNAVANAISTMLAYTGTLLIGEVLGGRNLEHAYGAGFEFVCPVRGADGDLALEKLPSLTTLFWRISPDGKTIAPVPLIFRQHYHNDILVIVRLAKDAYHNGVKVLKDEVFTHHITPIYRPIDDDEVPDFRALPPLDSAYLVNYIIDRLANGQTRVLMVIKSGPKPVTFLSPLRSTFENWISKWNGSPNLQTS